MKNERLIRKAVKGLSNALSLPDFKRFRKLWDSDPSLLAGVTVAIDETADVRCPEALAPEPETER